jgi:hypothetical protein
MFPSLYLSAFDLNGKDLTLTIIGISKEELRMQRGGSKVKPVMTFKETDKKVVLNKTNAESIATFHGTKAEEWVGRTVTFYATKCLVGRDTVDCLRVREKPSHPEPVRDPADNNQLIGRIDDLLKRLGWPMEHVQKVLMGKFGVADLFKMTSKQLSDFEEGLLNTIAYREKQNAGRGQGAT